MLARKINSANAGITLIEVIITLLISTILVMMVVPTFSKWIKNTEIRSTAESLRAAIQKSRIEAISRNASVKFRLTNSSGMPDWTISCIRISGNCPSQIKNKNTENNSLIRVGISKSLDLTSLNTAIESGNSLPAEIIFNSNGTAPNIANNTEISRIDIFNVSNQNTQRLVLIISVTGMIKLCNPAAVAPQSEAC